MNEEDVLRTVLANMKGKSIEDIQLKDGREKRGRKKKDEKPTFSNKEGLEIIEAPVKNIEWSDGKAKKQPVIRGNLELWTGCDFYLYAEKLYIDKYGENFNLRKGNSILQIARLRDDIEELFGFQSNLLIRDYFDYFFKYYIDLYKSKNKSFTFSQLRFFDCLKTFSETYNYRESFINFVSKKRDKKKTLKADELRAAFSLSPSTLLISYGIVIPINWLVQNKDMEVKEAIKYVFKECEHLRDVGQLDMVIKATEAYSPYPHWFIFKVPNVLFNKLQSGKTAEISFKMGEEIESQYSCIKRKKTNGI